MNRLNDILVKAKKELGAVRIDTGSLYLNGDWGTLEKRKERMIVIMLREHMFVFYDLNSLESWVDERIKQTKEYSKLYPERVNIWKGE